MWSPGVMTFFTTFATGNATPLLPEAWLCSPGDTPAVVDTAPGAGGDKPLSIFVVPGGTPAPGGAPITAAFVLAIWPFSAASCASSYAFLAASSSIYSATSGLTSCGGDTPFAGIPPGTPGVIEAPGPEEDEPPGCVTWLITFAAAVNAFTGGPCFPACAIRLYALSACFSRRCGGSIIGLSSSSLSLLLLLDAEACETPLGNAFALALVLPSYMAASTCCCT